MGTATTCDHNVVTNWVETFRPGAGAGCYGRYPIVYYSSAVKLRGNGYGQGILLVNGDLRINGKFEFFDLVIVRDDIRKGNGTAGIRGAVYSANTVLADPSVVADNQGVVARYLGTASTESGA